MTTSWPSSCTSFHWPACRTATPVILSAMVTAGKPIVTWSCETGALQVDFENETCSGDASEKAPLASVTGPDADSVASPAVDSTSAVVCAV